jgi:hypothetical protein
VSGCSAASKHFSANPNPELLLPDLISHLPYWRRSSRALPVSSIRGGVMQYSFLIIFGFACHAGLGVRQIGHWTRPENGAIK